MANKLKVLLLTSSPKDAVMTRYLLADFDIECEPCTNINELINSIDENTTGAIVLAKEALDPSGVDKLSSTLRDQPKWSSLPVIMLLSSGDLSSSVALDLLNPIPNLTLLERPIRQRALTSVIQSALADRKRQLELRDSLNEAIEANRAKSEFLANMSHEIRTPLGAVLGFSELVAEPGLSDLDRKVYLDIIRRNGQLLTALINDILDLSKVEAGRLHIEKTVVLLSEVLSEVVSSLEPRAREKDIRLIIRRQKNVPDRIITDPIRLKQILLNIAGNAIKFTEEGEVCIEVLASSSKTQSESLVFLVTDTGIGISPEQSTLLFQSFSQADSSITRRFGGTGLGLVLSQKLARALGGDLKLIQSEFGKGSTFEISVALVEGSAKASLTKVAEEEIIEVDELKDLRILLVDDSRDIQFLMSRLLSQTGATIYTAENGEEGVKKALEIWPDIVLMDVQMPILSGIDATKMLREKGFNQPIIALTAHALKGDRDQCFEAGFSDYLTKPVHKPVLYSTLKKHLKDSPEIAPSIELIK